MDHNEALQARIERVRKLIKTAKHVALATVNADGSPHNSPVFAAFDDGLQLVWASSPEARHSKNIARSGQVFVVVFDALGDGGGLYVQARAAEVSPDDMPQALETFNVARERLLREKLAPGYFMRAAPQRLYRAVPEKLWVNFSEKDANGHVVHDNRFEISLASLLRGQKIA